MLEHNIETEQPIGFTSHAYSTLNSPFTKWVLSIMLSLISTKVNGNKENF